MDFEALVDADLPASTLKFFELANQPVDGSPEAETAARSHSG
jgi:hypothetical protein